MLEHINIEEIAELLDCGFLVYVQKTTFNNIVVPDEDANFGMELEEYESEFEELEKNYQDYFKIEKWTTSEAFDIMKDFANQVKVENLQKELLNAINKKGPFKQFMFTIDNSGEHRQKWFDYSNNRKEAFVREQFLKLFNK
jgi:hypothetical protein